MFDLPKYGDGVCLARLAELLDALSVDRARLQRISVVVTGSNGKGSTAAFCAGIGAKAACPERPVVVFTGDAGFWYHIGEIETAVRWKLNSVTVVNNNGGGNQSKRGFDRAYGGTQTEQARELWTYTNVNFAKIAEDMGAMGIRVEKPSEFAPALAKAIAANRPVVIDVVTDIDAIAPTAVT